MSIGIMQAASFAMQAVSAGSTVMSALGQRSQAKEQLRIAEQEAAMMEDRANQEAALGQREAAKVKRANDALRARQRAVLAASGFSASDAGSEAIEGETLERQTISELMVLAEAQDRERQLRKQARLRREEGASNAQALRTRSIATLVNGGLSWYERFGGGGGGATAALHEAGHDAADRSPWAGLPQPAW